MVVQGSPTKVVKETKEETEINPKETKEAESQDSDTEFTVETEELEELEVFFYPIFCQKKLFDFRRNHPQNLKTRMKLRLWRKISRSRSKTVRPKN